MPPRFALDQNFPLNVLKALGHIPEVVLDTLQSIDPSLTAGHDDWEILLQLSKRGYDGFITADSSMIQLPRELVVLIQTNLTLVVVEDVGHDSLRATGLLLVYLPHIAHQSHKGTAQLWRLRPPPRRGHKDPWDELEAVAGRLGVTASSLFERERLTDSPYR